MKVVTVYLNGMTIGSGENASSPEKIKIVVKAGETYPAPTAAGLTPPQVGIVGMGLQWADNNGNYYAPGDSVPADVDQLTASWYRPEQGPQGEKGDPGDQGKPGTDGITPELKIGEDGIWYVSYDKGATWNSLGIKAIGVNGEKGETGAIGASGQDGANGASGKDGQTPYVGENGNWWIGGEDTGVKSQGVGEKPGGDRQHCRSRTCRKSWVACLVPPGKTKGYHPVNLWNKKSFPGAPG